ncbi:hypothetical protein Y1Q_0000538 [Alligator mississippiensis]|uniref:Uncharacterized protein n=1 Tax=Alligator mississippiensis TaxID=8496 RepID=A0A151MBF3_ALLMI|nr:hypothetical protein Y1Q_0000538 [Alligator mississippiensis]
MASLFGVVCPVSGYLKWSSFMDMGNDTITLPSIPFRACSSIQHNSVMVVSSHQVNGPTANTHLHFNLFLMELLTLIGLPRYTKI